MLALKYWQKWEQPRNHLGQPIGPWPDVTVYPNDPAVAMAIDENDFMNAWKKAKEAEAKNHRNMAYAGMKERPFAFTFKDSEKWDIINNKEDKVAWGKSTNRKGRV